MMTQGAILAVDGSPESLSMLVNILSATGCQVHSCHSGEMALADIANQTPDLILLDIRMEGSSGLQVFREIKARLKLCDIPIILTGASDDGAERLEASKLGAVDFIAKPFQREELLARVALHLELQRLRMQVAQQALEVRQTKAQLDNEMAERKQTQEALREAQWKFQALFEQGPIGVAYHQMIYDASGKPVDYRILDANGSYIELTGVDPRGKTVTQAFPGIENDPFDWIGTFGRVARTGEACRFERYLEFNGRWYDCVAYQYKPDHFVAAFLNITKHKEAESALRASEAKHNKMVANIGDVIVIIDSEGINRYKSPNIEKWFGWRPEEVVGAHALANIHPEDVAEAQKFIGSLLEAPRAVGTSECRYRCKDGSYKWIEFTGINLTLDPDICGILGNYHDITKRKQAEDALRESELFLRETQNIGRIGGWKLNPETDYLLWTEGVYRIIEAPLNYRPALSEGLRFYLPQYIPILRERLMRTFTTGEPFKVECEVITSTGKHLWTEVQGLVQTTSGKIPMVVGTLQDITERKQAEDALRESEHKYRVLVENANSIILRWNPQGEITFLNEYGQKFFGWRAEEIVGRRVHGTLVPDTESTGRDLSSLMDMVCASPVAFEQNINENMLRDGRRVWVAWTNKAVFDAAGKLIEVLSIGTDITERKHAEAETSKLQARLQQAQKLESIGQLAGGVAHDFNNILSVFMMHLDCLGDNRLLDHETQESLQELMLHAKRAANLTRQLLMFSRRSTMEVAVLDLNELVANLLKMLTRLIGEHIAIRFEPGANLPAIEADAGMIEQVLMNLSVNARDAMPKGGSLTIKTEAIQVDAERLKANPAVLPGPFLCLSVIDTGDGMDEATLKRIFEPFFTTKEAGKGTGLGLATVHGIAAQHKGWVEVESQPGHGATFKVFFPVTSKETAGMAQIGNVTVARGDETILLVEDEECVRSLVLRALLRLGYRVLEASNGQAALKIWHEHADQIDLLFSDMIMPGGLTGLDLARKMQMEKGSLKVVISSGYNSEMAERSNPAVEGFVFLQKPYLIQAMSQAIRNSLDKK